MAVAAIGRLAPPGLRRRLLTVTTRVVTVMPYPIDQTVFGISDIWERSQEGDFEVERGSR
jgi:hypothetical protein